MFHDIRDKTGAYTRDFSLKIHARTLRSICVKVPVRFVPRIPPVCFPVCSYSTIRRPISKLVATCRVLTFWLAVRRALCTRSRISLTSGRRGSPGVLVISGSGFISWIAFLIQRVGNCEDKEPGWRGESDARDMPELWGGCAGIFLKKRIFATWSGYAKRHPRDETIVSTLSRQI